MHVYLIFSSNLYTGNLGWVLTQNVIKFFLTLSNVGTIDPSLTIKTIESQIKTLFSKEKDLKILIVREEHGSNIDYHFHCLIISVRGLSKNTYISLFRNLFPLFVGRTIDIQGVKSVIKTIDYLFKNVLVKELMLCLSGGVRDIIYCSNLPFFLEKSRDFFYILVSFKIISFSTLHRFLLRDAKRYCLGVKRKSIIQTCWDLSRSFLKFPLVTEEIKKIDAPSIYDFFSIVRQYNLQWVHLRVLTRILFFILIKEGVIDQPVKSKNLFIVGDPNTGKTSLLYKIIEVFNNYTIFHFVGTRVNDFSGFQPALKPIIVFDDALKRFPYFNWRENLLLKVLGHEPVSVDVKYGFLVEIPPRNCIIISNDGKLFENYWNLEARVIYCDFGDQHANWSKIRNDDFKKLVFILLEDLFDSLKNPTLFNEIKYGVEE